MKSMYVNNIHKIVIFGNTGFIGTQLNAYFLKYRPKIDLIGFSHRELDLLNPSKLTILSEVFTNNTAVVMLSGIKPNIGDDIRSCSKNIQMVVNLSTILQKYPVARCIYVSSAAVYGEDVKHSIISESTPVDPRSFYGMGKYVSERIIWKSLIDSTDTSLAIVRPPVIYGPGELLYANSPSGFFANALKEKPIRLWGDGREKREFIYIDDAVKILDLLTFHSYNGIVNLVSGVSYSFADIIHILSKRMHKKVSVETLKRTKQKVDVQFDASVLKHVIGTVRFTTLEEGIAKIIDESTTSI